MKQGLFSKSRLESLKDLKVAVLCGGVSSEKVISRRSGRAIYSALKRTGLYTKCFDPSRVDYLKRVLKQFDLAFIALHGKGGEDGQIQSDLEKISFPYVGSDPEGCRKAFDKKIAKDIFIRKGIPTPPYQIMKKNRDFKKIKNIPRPFFVKPLQEGSSIGAFPVYDLAKSTKKILEALNIYGEILIEKLIEGREFTVGILGRKALPVVEVKPKRLFYDYRAKYTKGMTEYLTPAPISERFSNRLKKIALKAHRTLGMRDLSRVDMMVDGKGKAYVLEVNVIPGFTEFSLLPKAARCGGISFENLCCQLVDWAHFREKNGHVVKGCENGKKKI